MCVLYLLSSDSQDKFLTRENPIRPLPKLVHDILSFSTTTHNESLLKAC